MKTVIRKIFGCGLLLIFVASLAACHTVNGVGQDVQAGGHAISGAAYDD